MKNKNHLDWIRRQACTVKKFDRWTGCYGAIAAHHHRRGTGGGMGMKPDDRFTVPLCMKHHAELHNTGARTFEARYGVDLRAVADRLAQASPHLDKPSDKE